MVLRKKVKKWLCLCIPRYKLYCIRKVLGLRKVEWQTDFALGHNDWMPSHMDRRSGKTTAVMLRMLMQKPRGQVPYKMLRYDRYTSCRGGYLAEWCRGMYWDMAKKCLDAGIPVPDPITRNEKVKVWDVGTVTREEILEQTETIAFLQRRITELEDIVDERSKEETP